MSEAEVARVVAGQPFHSLADFWNRAHVSRPVTERLVLAGGFDTVYGIDTVGAAVDPGRPRHRGLRAAHAPEGGGRGARGYGSADDAELAEPCDGVPGEAGDAGRRGDGVDADGSGRPDAESVTVLPTGLTTGLATGLATGRSPC
jgi:error-prone DNA polymerase